MTTNWNETYTSGRDYRVMNELLLEKILVEVGGKPAGEALDIGCGTGDLAVKLAKRGYTVTGLDLSDVAIKKAGERSVEAGVADKTKFLALNIENAEQAQALAGKKYDFITCKLAIAFVADKSAFLAWIKDHLAEGGAVVVITPVLHDGVSYGPRLTNISVDYEVLLKLFHGQFSGVNEVNIEYFDEWGDERSFVLTK